MGHRVEDVAPLAQELPQRRPEQGGEALHEALRTDQADAERTAHGAARAVCCHQIAGVHRARRARAHVAHAGADAVRPGQETGQLRGELDPCARGGAQVVEQERLDVVLRHAGRGRRADHAALLGARVAHRQRRAVGGVRERLRLEHPPVDLDAALAHLRLQTPRSHHLHRAQAQHGRAWVRGQARTTLDEQGRDAVARQLGRRGQPGGTGADHQHRGLECCRGGHGRMVHAVTPAHMSNGYSIVRRPLGR
jgi:hypothetical protein